jgi:cytochrome c6
MPRKRWPGVPIPVPGSPAFPVAGKLLVLALALAAIAPPARAADPGKGGALYAVHCAACHGSRGEPVWPGAPDFRRPGVLMKTDHQLLTLLRQGRGLMPSYLAVMKEREMLDLMAFLRTLS